MSKPAIIWMSVQSLLILALYFWMLFFLGDKPLFESRVQQLEQNVEKIDYGLKLISSSSSDTIIVNNYIQK